MTLERHKPSKTALATLSAGGALALLVVGAMAMGISPVFVRNAELGPFASAFWRVTLALPLLYVWARTTRRADAPSLAAQARRGAVLLAGLFFAGDLLFWHLAILNTSIANATFLSCLAPIWVTLLSRMTLDEEVSRWTLYGLAACVPGTALLILSSAGGGSGHWVGDVYGLVTSFFFGLYFLAVRGARRHMGAGEITLLLSIVSAFVLFVVVIASGEGLVPATSRGAANLLALGIVSHVGGQGLLAVALGVLSASFSSLVIFVEALAAALFAWAFTGEALAPLQVAGGALILVGIWIARPRPASAKAASL